MSNKAEYMKYGIVLGGFLGFLITFISGLLANNPMDIALRDASVGCVIGAILLKIFFRVLEINYHSARLNHFRQEDEKRKALEEGKDDSENKG